MKEFAHKLFKAIYVFFVTVIIYSLFVLPWKIWISSVNRLSTLFDEGDIIKRYNSSEIKVLSWLSLFFEAIIFISYIIGLGLIVSLFFKTGPIGFKLRFVFFVSYFLPVLLSFLKEIISLSLLKYFKLEAIEENTAVNNVYKK